MNLPRPNIAADGHGWEPIITTKPNGNAIDWHGVFNCIDDDCMHAPLAILQSKEEAELWAKVNIVDVGELSRYGTTDWHVAPIRDLSARLWNSVEHVREEPPK